MRRFVLVLLLFVATALRGGEPIPFELQRVEGEIRVDGRLDDSGWRHAPSVEQFTEHLHEDNVAPPVRTRAMAAYDDDALYIAVEALEPHLDKLRAPLVERDQVDADQDYVSILLDTAGDRRSAYLFRVNARGVQTDGTVTDPYGSLNLSPDFYFQSAATIVDDRWFLELRIPLTSVRFTPQSIAKWGLLIARNYPREFRYAMGITPIPRNTNCLVCHIAPLQGIEGIEARGSLVATPYATASSNITPGSSDGFNGETGVDVKYSPTASFTLDGTLNPDFSQIEADAPQFDVNTRFALLYPEKRSFFLEGVDLLSTPLRAVQTRSINAPAWGLRATGRSGDTEYTLLAATDRSGGSLLLPGATGNQIVTRDRDSTAVIGRIRRSYGSSFIGALLTTREGEEGHNRVLGPDFLWVPNSIDRLSGQFLFSQTEDEARPAISARLDGQSRTSHAARVTWARDAAKYDTWLNVESIGDHFRADNGFMPQAGYRSWYAEAGYHWNRSGNVSFVRPYTFVDRVDDSNGSLLRSSFAAGVYFVGRWNSDGWITFKPGERERIGGAEERFSFAEFTLRTKPHRLFPLFQLEGVLGERPDYANQRPGRGGRLALSSTTRPTTHLDVQLLSQREWLDVESQRLFTAEMQRVRATYNFTTRSSLRAIAQQTDITRDPLLYASPVAAQKKKLSTSLLYGYRLDIQTVLYVGYGDVQTLNETTNDLQSESRSLFMKLAYARR